MAGRRGREVRLPGPLESRPLLAVQREKRLQQGKRRYSGRRESFPRPPTPAPPGRRVSGEQHRGATETLSSTCGKVSSKRPQESPLWPLPHVPGWRPGERRPPTPQLSAPGNSYQGRVRASSPVINYRTQGGICKPHITNSSGLK